MAFQLFVSNSCKLIHPQSEQTLPTNETASVNSILGQFLENSTAFEDLTDLMSRLGADDATLEDYIIILFNSQDAIDLLVASVGTDSDAQQSVFDAIGDNIDAKATFLIALGGNLAINLDWGSGSDGSEDYTDYTLPAGFTLPTDFTLPAGLGI